MKITEVQDFVEIQAFPYSAASTYHYTWQFYVPLCIHFCLYV